MATTGEFNVTLAADPWNTASPNANTPPLLEVSQ
jgi:hypothetical protein